MSPEARGRLFIDPVVCECVELGSERVRKQFPTNKLLSWLW